MKNNNSYGEELINKQVVDYILFDIIHGFEIHPSELNGDNDYDRKVEIMYRIFSRARKEDNITDVPVIQKIIEAMSFTDGEALKNNPYNKTVDFSKMKNRTIENHKLTVVPNRAGSLLLGNMIKDNDLNLYYPKLVYYTQKIRPLALTYNSKTYMSITENEIYTMERNIDKANGKIVVCGLGLGYFPYMCGRKDNVTEITIVEKEENVIKLFEDNILWQFEKHIQDKIQTVHADAFDYLKNLPEDSFDYMFIDLWWDAADIIPYKTIKDICYNRDDNDKIEFWIVDAMEESLQSAMELYMRTVKQIM